MYIFQQHYKFHEPSLPSWNQILEAHKSYSNVYILWSFQLHDQANFSCKPSREILLNRMNRYLSLNNFLYLWRTFWKKNFCLFANYFNILLMLLKVIRKILTTIWDQLKYWHSTLVFFFKFLFFFLDWKNIDSPPFFNLFNFIFC